MRTSLPEIRQTAPAAGPERRNPDEKLALLQQKRSGGDLGEAETVNQTFLNVKLSGICDFWP